MPTANDLKSNDHVMKGDGKERPINKAIEEVEMIEAKQVER